MPTSEAMITLIKHTVAKIKDSELNKTNDQGLKDFFPDLVLSIRASFVSMHC